jgi:hypothetical protein
VKFYFGGRIALRNISARGFAFFLIPARQHNLRAFLSQDTSSF